MNFVPPRATRQAGDLESREREGRLGPRCAGNGDSAAEELGDGSQTLSSGCGSHIAKTTQLTPHAPGAQVRLGVPRGVLMGTLFGVADGRLPHPRGESRVHAPQWTPRRASCHTGSTPSPHPIPVAPKGSTWQYCPEWRGFNV